MASQIFKKNISTQSSNIKRISLEENKILFSFYNKILVNKKYLNFYTFIFVEQQEAEKCFDNLKTNWSAKDTIQISCDSKILFKIYMDFVRYDIKNDVNIPIVDPGTQKDVYITISNIKDVTKEDDTVYINLNTSVIVDYKGNVSDKLRLGSNNSEQFYDYVKFLLNKIKEERKNVCMGPLKIHYD